MNCFSCFTSQKSKKDLNEEENEGAAPETGVPSRAAADNEGKHGDGQSADIKAQSFTFRELATATKNFRQECVLGEGGFGRVYKGTIPATGKVVAVKQLDRNGIQGSNDFLKEVATLSHINHENLVNLVGYCADGDQRLLVYEYMPGGSVDSRLFDGEQGEGNKAPIINWYSRMKIALGVASGLEYLHDKANPPVIFRDLKSSNIMLDHECNAKLSDFGLSKLSGGDKMNLISPGVTGTYGYSAPEYARTGQATMKTDVYGFGVVFLELISGRRALDTSKPNEEQNLVSWAQPYFKNPKNFPELADPRLNKKFPEKDLNQAVAVAAMCLQEEEGARPLMSDVVATLSFLTMVAPAEPEPEPKAEEGGSSGSESGSEEEEDEEGYSDEYTDDDDDDDDDYEDEVVEEGGKGSKKFFSKSSRKSSKKSPSLSQKSSKKTATSSASATSMKKKSSKKTTSVKQKSGKKSMSQKIGLKKAGSGIGRILSKKKSKSRASASASEDEGSSRDVSFGLTSRGSGSGSDKSVGSGRRSTNGNGVPRLPHAQTTKQPQKDNKGLLATASAKV